MTTYTKATNFATKDALLTGNPAKVVKGTEIDAEFTAIQAADATSLKSGGALGTPASGTLTNCTGLPGTGATFLQAGTGATSRTAQDKMRDIVSVKDFGAFCDGSTDDYAAIQEALDAAFSAGGVVTATGACKVSAPVLVKAGVEFQFNKLIPSTSSNSVLTIYGGAAVSGTVDTSAFPTYSVEAVVIDGDGETNGSPFRVHTKTAVDLVVNGGGSTGKAIHFKATGTSARIMGVQLNAHINKFAVGCYLEQTSTDLSKFINSNNLTVNTSDTVVAIEMASSYSTGYGIDGNTIISRGQPLLGTTSPLYILCGQDNSFDLLPWDWDGVAGTAPYACTLRASSRRNVFIFRTDFAYFQNSSTDTSNIFTTPFENGVQVYSLIGYSASGILPIVGVNPQIENAKFFSGKKAAGTNQNLLGIDSSNNTILDCASGGIYAIRINGTNKLYIETNLVSPGSDLSLALGSTSSRWTNVFAGGAQFTGNALTGAAGTVSLGGVVSTTVGAGGGASALPATPLGYWSANVAGTPVKIPYYSV